MKIFLLLLVLSSISLAAVARKACTGVPYNGAVATCYHASGTKLIYDLCIQTMKEGGIDLSPSHKEETTVYAILTVSAAVASSTKTTNTLTNQLQNNGSLSGPERAAYGECLNDYVAALNSLYHPLNVMLPNCFFAGIADDYVSGLNNLESCRDRFLGPLMNTSPLYPLVMADRSKVLLAFSLGKLLL